MDTIELYNLGQKAYYNKDYKTALKYYEQAAELNHASAIVGLGQMYRWGHGVKRNCLKAQEYYERAIKLNDVKAMEHLAFLLIDYGDNTLETDRSNGIKLIIEAYRKSGDRKYISKLYHYAKNTNDQNLLSQIFIELMAKTVDLESQLTDMQKKIHDLEVKFTYQPDGPGYHTAKKEFELIQGLP